MIDQERTQNPKITKKWDEINKNKKSWKIFKKKTIVEKFTEKMSGKILKSWKNQKNQNKWKNQKKKLKKIDTKHENLKIKKHWAQQYIFSKKSIKKWKFYWKMNEKIMNGKIGN